MSLTDECVYGCFQNKRHLHDGKCFYSPGSSILEDMVKKQQMMSAEGRTILLLKKNHG